MTQRIFSLTQQPRALEKPHHGQPRSTTDHDGNEVNPFPLWTLPESVGEMAQAIADIERTPASLAGVCTLGFLSAAIGKGLDVQSKPGRPTSPSCSPS